MRHCLSVIRESPLQPAHQAVLPINKIIKIPNVFNEKEMAENALAEILVEAAINGTPISSGKGEAIMKAANTGKKNDLTCLGIVQLMAINSFSFLNFSISSEKECLINLKISKSLNKAPRPPINPAISMFCSLARIRNMAVAGAAVNP